MIRRPPISTRTDTLFPYTTLFRSCACRPSRRSAALLRIFRCRGVELQRLLGRPSRRLESGGGVSRRGAVRQEAAPGDAGLRPDQPAAFSLWAGADPPCFSPHLAPAKRSEERRVGKEWVSTCRSGGSPNH